MNWLFNLFERKKIIRLSENPKVQKKIQKFWDNHGQMLMDSAVKGLAIKLAYQKGLEDSQ